MDDETQEEEVNLIFMLGLNKPHSQLEVLKELMGLIQEEEVVKKIISSKDVNEIKSILEAS
ncbi:Phosphoenolpyruvate-dependent sugar phosphotransferase system, EIIA 2 [compost metagenome]